MSQPRFVVDTSALIAVLDREVGWFALSEALVVSSHAVPTPVLVETWRVARRRDIISAKLVSKFIDEVVAGAEVLPFTTAHAEAACAAAESYGTGNGRGGQLNLVDLMVYAVAKTTGLPILCTGNDFASTDIAIHPTSRVG